MTTTALPRATSGFCGIAAHHRCPGVWRTWECDCPCHQEPEPQDPVTLFATVTHSAGVASVGYGGKLAHAVCSCGWAADEPRQRNHDAFDDARAHLAAASAEVGA